MCLHTVQTLIDEDLAPQWDFLRTGSVAQFAVEKFSIRSCSPGLQVEQYLSVARLKMGL